MVFIIIATTFFFGVPFAVDAALDVVDITMVGDIMLDRNVRKALPTFSEPEGPFVAIASLLKASAITVGNLEGTITGNPTRAIKGNLSFTFDPSVRHLLKAAGFTVLSLANNHSHDFGAQGLVETKEALKDVAIPFFGDFANDPDAYNIIPGSNDTDIVLIGFEEAPWLRDVQPTLASIKQRKQECATVTPARKCFVIVMPHWGIEYKRLPSPRQKKLAYQFIDAGADMVVGGHPHVVQPFEIYHGKPIFYSLGNFIFDQWFSKETTEGLMLRMTMHSGELAIQLVPTSIHCDASVHRMGRKAAEQQIAWIKKNAIGKKGTYTLDGDTLRVPR
ncbi:CapA family protein [Candidatus Uhrbacteria bacterium]|nr:CapA family protein [Candidatus Uhrbacteria bacterium]